MRFLDKLSQIFTDSLQMLKDRCPVDTGRMHDEAIDGYNLDDFTFRMVVSGSIVEYVVYTNEQWISETWGAARFKNPNYHWIDNAVKDIVQHIALTLGGEVSVDEEALRDRLTNKEYFDTVYMNEE